jgi:hypothetical protein
MSVSLKRVCYRPPSSTAVLKLTPVDDIANKVEALEVISHSSNAARGDKAIIHTSKPPDNPASRNAVFVHLQK